MRYFVINLDAFMLVSATDDAKEALQVAEDLRVQGKTAVVTVTGMVVGNVVLLDTREVAE